MDETDDETTLDEGTAEAELPTLELSIETEDELDGTTGVTRAEVDEDVAEDETSSLSGTVGVGVTGTATVGVGMTTEAEPMGTTTACRRL